MKILRTLINAGNLTEAPVIQFAVLKAVQA